MKEGNSFASHFPPYFFKVKLKFIMILTIIILIIFFLEKLKILARTTSGNFEQTENISIRIDGT